MNQFDTCLNRLDIQTQHKYVGLERLWWYHKLVVYRRHPDRNRRAIPALSDYWSDSNTGGGRCDHVEDWRLLSCGPLAFAADHTIAGIDRQGI